MTALPQSFYLENNHLEIPEEPALQLVPANLLKRFLNYIIDFMVFAFPASFLLMLAAPGHAWASNLVYNLNNKPEAVTLLDQSMIWFVYGLYISITESLLKGKTIGKYITGTRAVNKQGLAITAETAFVRGLIRMIPFEQFSALSIPPRPWHDRWSGSVVIDEKKSILPNS